ncbi:MULTISPECIES: hypothetical protein [unclassified Azospirillum]|uniref:hypothetical protein n=1 Tax=unclassified Azospirillum TaxID=2630922 RepID=UPI000B6C22F8|nr:MULTISPECIES: hypothetical protein [unclassified Azospirillum]SNR89535.1 hypothetical protein SAMN05880556_101396 [Azospirillum sp. RU38E]SNS05651.1 hypothetical protein SAMN05880591_101396 [Azospirillum sp. RU37A]
MENFNKIIALMAILLLATGCQIPVHNQNPSNEIPNFSVHEKIPGKYQISIIGAEKLSIDYMLEYPIKAILKLDQKNVFTEDALNAFRQRYTDVILFEKNGDEGRIPLTLEVKQARIFATCGSISLFKGTCTAEGKVTLALTMPGNSAPVTAIGEEVITSPPNSDILEPLHDVGPKALRRAQAKALAKLISPP